MSSASKLLSQPFGIILAWTRVGGVKSPNHVTILQIPPDPGLCWSPRNDYSNIGLHLDAVIMYCLWRLLAMYTAHEDYRWLFVDLPWVFIVPVWDTVSMSITMTRHKCIRCVWRHLRVCYVWYLRQCNTFHLHQPNSSLYFAQPLPRLARNGNIHMISVYCKQVPANSQSFAITLLPDPLFRFH